MPDPTSFLQWLHQTYTNAWKGTVDITTVPAEDHAPKNSHWLSTITASGAVVKKDGKNHTLQVRTQVSRQSSRAVQERVCLLEAEWHRAEGWMPHLPSVPHSVVPTPPLNLLSPSAVLRSKLH
jgi:hypothetical protein